jgi:hypothetical protein
VTFIGFLVLLCAGSPAFAGPPVHSAVHAFPGLSMAGPTGMILVPTGQVVRSNWYAAGLHRGAFKAAVGILNVAEIGFALPDLYEDPSRHTWLNETHGFVKLGGEVLPDRWWLPGLAAGADNSALRLAKIAGLHNAESRKAANLESLYGTASWWWNVLSWPVEATAGAGTGRFDRRAFGAVSFIPVTFFGNTLKFTGEYAGQAASIGARFALSRSLRLDFAMLLHAVRDREATHLLTITVDRGILGASQSGPIAWDFFKAKPKEPAKPR